MRQGVGRPTARSRSGPDAAQEGLIPHEDQNVKGQINTLGGDCRDCGTLPAAQGTELGRGPRPVREACGCSSSRFCAAPGSGGVVGGARRGWRGPSSLLTREQRPGGSRCDRPVDVDILAGRGPPSPGRDGSVVHSKILRPKPPTISRWLLSGERFQVYAEASGHRTISFVRGSRHRGLCKTLFEKVKSDCGAER
jgi:hypothetical protein